MNTESSIIQEADAIRHLIRKYLSGQLSYEENRFLQNWLAASPHNLQFFQEITDKGQFAMFLQKYSKNMALVEKDGIPDLFFKDSIARPVHRGIRPSVPFLRRWGWAAASVIFLIAATVFLVESSDRPAGHSKEAIVNNGEIQPGKDGAILTLADGSQVVLDSMGNGMIASQNGSEVVLKNGLLAYDPTGAADGDVVYNTMSTPKGRQFQVILPDGTKVWLNAASSIRYPTVFTGKERKVDITGEVYFEVARNKKMPFRVTANNKAEVEVLGTHFNVNAYENERSISTTLIEGSVRVLVGQKTQQGMEERSGHKTSQVVSSDRPAVTLKPGQQAQLLVGQKTQHGINVVNANIDKVMAWKNGLFNFEGATLEEVMKQLERWYDIEVVYEKGTPNIRFEGEMTKGLVLADLLMALERSDVNFRIEGRKLIVLP